MCFAWPLVCTVCLSLVQKRGHRQASTVAWSQALQKIQGNTTGSFFFLFTSATEDMIWGVYVCLFIYIYDCKTNNPYVYFLMLVGPYERKKVNKFRERSGSHYGYKTCGRSYTDKNK